MTIGRDSLKNSNKTDFATYDTVAELEAAPASRFSDGAEILLRGIDVLGDIKAVSAVVESAAAGVKGFALTDGRFANIYSDVAISKWFGLDGASAADQKTQWQDFINSSAKEKKLLPGTYFIGGISTTANNCEIHGKNATVKAHSSLTSTTPMWTQTGDNVTIHDLKFDGNTSNITGTGSLLGVGRLTITGTNVLIEFCDFTNFKGTAIYATGLIKNLKVFNNTFTTLGSASSQGRCLYVDLLTTGSEDIQFSHNRAFDTSGVNIKASGILIEHITVTYNKLQRRGSILVQAPKCTVSYNEIDPEHQPHDPNFPSLTLPITVETGAGAIIHGNKIQGFLQVGIECVGSLERDYEVGDNPLPSYFQASGTLLNAKMYRIETFVEGDDFSNIASVNATASVFTATGITPTTWSNGSSLVNMTDGGTQTSGSLIVGKVYRVKSFGAGDNFNNVALNINVSGSSFLTTGTTPTTWANASVLIPVSDLVHEPSSIMGNVLRNNATSAQITAVGVSTWGIQCGTSTNNLFGTVISGNSLESCGISIYGDRAAINPAVDDLFNRMILITGNYISDHIAHTDGVIRIEESKNVTVSGNKINKRSPNGVGNSAFAINVLASHDTTITDNDFYNVLFAAKEPVISTVKTALNEFPNGLYVTNNRIFNTPTQLYRGAIGQEVTTGLKAGRLLAFNNMSPKSTGLNNDIILDSQGWDTFTIGGTIADKNAFITLDGTVSDSKLQARTRFSALNRDFALGQIDELIIGKPWLIQLSIHFADELSAGTNNISRIIFGKSASNLGMGVNKYNLSPATFTNYNVTNPSGTTFRYTYGGTGADPYITSDTVPVGASVVFGSTNFAAGNQGTFTVTGSGANFIEVDNASGVVEAGIQSGVIGSIYVALVYHTFGIELRGSELYGFYSNGTTVTYTPLLYLIPSNNSTRTDVAIQSSGGGSAALLFGVSFEATSTPFFQEAIYNIGSFVSNGTGGIPMGPTCYLEYNGTGAGGKFNVGSIRITDMGM